MVSPEVDSQNAGSEGVNWLRFESIRTIRRELSVAKSNRNTGNLFALGNNAVRTSGSQDL